MDLSALLQELKREEGFSSVPYNDHLGFLTIGYGTNIDAVAGGISKAEAEFLLRSRVQIKYTELDAALLWFQNMPEAVQCAMVAMAYQMGTEGLLKFKNTMAFLSMKKFDRAADEALDSKWAKQTPERAARVAEIIRRA